MSAEQLRLLFVSDWRIQPLDWIERVLDEHAPIDLLLYGGDDVGRFLPLPERPHRFSLELARAYGLKLKDGFDLLNVRWEQLDPERVVAAARKVLGLPQLFEPLPPSAPMTPGRVLRLFRRTDRDNLFTGLGIKTKYGVAGVIGNDCPPEDRYVLDAPHVRNLHAVPTMVGGWGFVGIEGSIVSRRRGDGQQVNDIGFVLHDDRGIRAHLEQAIGTLSIGPSLLVIVSHTPPRGMLDIGLRFGIEHLGSPALATFIRRHQPALVLCGHCHSCGGRVHQCGRTLVINAASDDQKARTSRIALIELDPDRPPRVTWLDPATKNSLLTVPNIGPVREARLTQLGITTPGQLFEASDETLRAAKFGEIGINKIRGFGRALAQGQPVWLPGPRLELPADLLFYDLETGLGTRPAGWSPFERPPLAEPWIIGAWVPGMSRPKQWVAATERRAERRAMFKAFLDFLRTHPDFTLCSWSGSRFDERAMDAGLEHWHRAGLKEWQAAPKIDLLLFPNLRRRLILPSGEWSVQRVASTLGLPEPPSTGLTGFEVGFAYERYRAFGEKLPIRAIRAYNAADVLALGHIAAWLRQNDPGAPALPTDVPDPNQAAREHPDGAVYQSDTGQRFRLVHPRWIPVVGRKPRQTMVEPSES